MDRRLEDLEMLRLGLIKQFQETPKGRGTTAANVANALRAVLEEIQQLSGSPEGSKSDELKRRAAENIARLTEAESRIDSAIRDNERSRSDRTSG